MAYDDIVEALVNRRLVLFTGAGIVRDAGLPDWNGLATGLKDELVDTHGQARGTSQIKLRLT